MDRSSGRSDEPDAFAPRRTPRMSRRDFLKLGALGTGGALLAACGTTPPTQSSATTDTTALAPSAAETSAVSTTGAANVSSVAPTAAARPDGWKSTLMPPPKKYDPALTITQNFTINGAAKFINNESIEDNVMSRWLKDEMGIYYEPKWAAQSPEASDQQWATALASGDLPELMVVVNQENYARLKRADQLADITEIWERVASEQHKAKKQYPDGPLWRRFKQPDGTMKIDALPWSAEVATSDNILWMRKDWLDKVGLQQPKTLDELATAAAAFKKDGLAKIGISVAQELRTFMSSVDFVFAAYDSMPGYWRKGSDGTLQSGTIQPAVKEALNVLRGWYADGLIDPEFVTTDASKSTEAIAANQVGIFTGPYWVPNWPLPDARTNDPSAQWTFYDNPAGPNGRRGRALTPMGTSVQVFLKGTDPQKIEAVINEANWNLDRFLTTFETRDYFNCPCQGYGMIFENYDYAWQGNQLTLGPSGTTGPWAYQGGREHTWLYQDVLKDYFDQIGKVQSKGADSMNPMEQYLALDPVQKENADAYNLVYSTLDSAIATEFTGALTATMLQAGANLEKLEQETLLGIITGQKPLEAFDQFVSDWKAQGGDKITEEVNAWASGG